MGVGTSLISENGSGSLCHKLVDVVSITHPAAKTIYTLSHITVNKLSTSFIFLDYLACVHINKCPRKRLGMREYKYELRGKKRMLIFYEKGILVLINSDIKE